MEYLNFATYKYTSTSIVCMHSPWPRPTHAHLAALLGPTYNPPTPTTSHGAVVQSRPGKLQDREHLVPGLAGAQHLLGGGVHTQLNQHRIDRSRAQSSHRPQTRKPPHEKSFQRVRTYVPPPSGPPPASAPGSPPACCPAQPPGTWPHPPGREAAACVYVCVRMYVGVRISSLCRHPI